MGRKMSGHNYTVKNTFVELSPGGDTGPTSRRTKSDSDSTPSPPFASLHVSAAKELEEPWNLESHGFVPYTPSPFLYPTMPPVSEALLAMEPLEESCCGAYDGIGGLPPSLHDIGHAGFFPTMGSVGALYNPYLSMCLPQDWVPLGAAGFGAPAGFLPGRGEGYPSILEHLRGGINGHQAAVLDIAQAALEGSSDAQPEEQVEAMPAVPDDTDTRARPLPKNLVGAGDGGGGPWRDGEEKGATAGEQSRRADDAGGSSAVGTTVMLRNIPNKYTRTMLLNQVNVDFKGQVDFIYLPIDFRNKCNVGYAFINFRSLEPTERFIRMYDGVSVSKCLPGLNSQKVAQVTPARVHGLQDNVDRLRNSPIMSELVDHPEWMPLILDENGCELPFPQPEHVLPAIKPRGRRPRNEDEGGGGAFAAAPAAAPPPVPHQQASDHPASGGGRAGGGGRGGRTRQKHHRADRQQDWAHYAAAPVRTGHRQS